MKPQPITIQGHNEITQDGEKNTIDFEVSGQYYQMQKALYLEYEEEQEGEAVSVRVKIIPGDGLVIRRKSKALVSQLPLLTSGENQVHYQLSEGYQIELVAQVNQFNHVEDQPGEGSIHCVYTLTNPAGEVLGEYGLELKYQS